MEGVMPPGVIAAAAAIAATRGAPSGMLPASRRASSIVESVLPETIAVHATNTASGSAKVFSLRISRSSTRPSAWLPKGISWTMISESVSFSNVIVRKSAEVWDELVSEIHDLVRVTLHAAMVG